jgi:glycosyltransferase involved in cell wall biosynthesis
MLKFAYITDVPLDRAYSGTAARIRDGLIAEGHTVIEVLVLIPGTIRVTIAKSLISRFSGKILIAKREPSVLRKLHSLIAGRLAELEVDVIFSHFDWLIPFYQNENRWRKSSFVVTWPDNYFGDFINFYSSPWSSYSIRNGWEQSKLYYETADLTIYSSEWGNNGAKKCGIIAKKPQKIGFIPYGVNLVAPPALTLVEAAISQRFHGKIKLIWIGRDADRKGLATALEVLEMMTNRGCQCELLTIGYTGGDFRHSRVCHLGVLDRRNIAENEVFQRELLSADFLILPTKADCTPMVFGEAASCGVPSLTYEVGGVSSVVLDGITGKVFPLGAPASQFADYLTILSREDYLKLASAARRDTEERLNWRVSIRRFLEVLRSSMPALPTV